MLFNSYAFIALLLPTLALFWATRIHAVRLSALFVASLIFYAWYHWPSVFLLLASIATNYTFGLLNDRRRSRALLALAIALNLSALVCFKYARFFSLPVQPGWMPLGISFFTFQVIAYQVDVYRGRIAAERSLLVFAVFKSFFAQLIAGPIVRAEHFLPQLRSVARFDATQMRRGVYLFLFGLCLKSAIADVLAQFANTSFAAPAELATNEAWLGMFAYAFQLFCDFWGYSTMAVALGLMFGLELPVNFRLPYLARSLQEFWRRWHITLSEWFRDYLYIPLGGNRALRNLLITMTLAGLWHGAGWNFLLWGFLHGVWLAVERLSKIRLGVVPVFLGVCLLWVLFRAPTFDVALAYYGRLFLPPYTWQPRVPEELPIWLIASALLTPVLYRFANEDRLSLRGELALSMSFVFLCLAYGGARFDFIYFNF